MVPTVDSISTIWTQLAEIAFLSSVGDHLPKCSHHCLDQLHSNNRPKRRKCGARKCHLQFRPGVWGCLFLVVARRNAWEGYKHISELALITVAAATNAFLDFAKPPQEDHLPSKEQD